MKYLLMGGACSSILVHGFSWQFPTGVHGFSWQFPTGVKARDKGFDNSIVVVVVVAFSAIPIEMIDSYSS
jgi:hypothetical protein